MAMRDVTTSATLRVLWPHDFDRRGEWAVGGVPFHRGELDPDTPVGVVDDDGDTLPLQTRVLGYWPDGSVKWLLVITRPDLTGDTDATPLELVVGDEIGDVGGNYPTLSVTEDASEITVDAGAVAFTVPKDESALLGSLRVDGREMLDGRRPELFVETGKRGDETTTRFTDCGDEDATFRSVEVEEAGPYRAVVAVEGTHVADDGSTFSPFTVRLYAFAGESDVRLTHTFTYDGIPEEDLVYAVGLEVPVNVSAPREYAYGGNVGPATRSAADRREDWEMAWSRGELYQESATAFRFQKRVGSDDPPVTMETGGRSDGWVDLSDDAGGLCVAVGDAWRKYPTALAMDADAGTVTASLWPKRHEPLDFGWYSETAYGHVYESPGTTTRENTPRIPTMDAHGVATTHELLLAFHGEETDGELAERVRAFDDPARVAVSPERYAETRVFGTYAADASASFPEQEAWFEEGLEYILQEQEFRGWYGTFDYGDIVRSYHHETDTWANDMGGHGWLNTEFQPDQWLWVTFLRTGRYDAFRFAEAMARHTTDTDVLQLGPWWGFGSRHGVQHWSDGDREVRVSMPGGRRIHYFLTGDERTRDVVELAVARYRTMQREPGRVWMGFRDEMYTRTDVATALFAYFVAWEMTGEDRYESLVRNIVSTVYCDLHPKGAPYNRARIDLSTGEGEPVRENVISSNMFLQFGGLQILCELADSGDFPDLADAVLKYADYQLLPYEERRATGDNAGRGLGHLVRSMPLHAFAYRKTGGEDHRKALEEALTDPEISFEPAPWDESMRRPRNDVQSPPCSLAAFARKAPYAMEALVNGPEAEGE